METPVLLFCVALPLVGAALVVAFGRWPNLREAVSLVASVSLFLLVLALLSEVEAGGRPRAVLASFVPEVPFALEVEPLG